MTVFNIYKRNNYNNDTHDFNTNSFDCIFAKSKSGNYRLHK